MAPVEKATRAEILYHLLEEIKDLKDDCKDSQSKIIQLDKELEVLKAKIWAFATIAGLVAGAVINLAIKYLKVG